jgi:hypothetical protein
MTAPHTYALGRHVEHDERSRNFAAMVPAVKPKTVLWAHSAPVLDQGQLGSCTGNALAQWLNTDYARMHEFDGLRAPLTEAAAVELYSAATRIDNVPGHYPPVDTGSSGLAVCKAGVRAKYLTAYRWVFAFNALLLALQTSPVITGTGWYTDMFTPDRNNIIRPTGDLQGGHEYLILGADLERERLTILNSWGPGWGRNGRAFISFTSFGRLLRDHGDVTVPIL